MSSGIKADFQQMFALSQKMFDTADQFRNRYENMFSVINNDLSSAWKGPDSDSFIERTNGVHIKFKNMYEILCSYAEFVLDSARRYEKEAQENSEDAGEIEL